MRVRREDQEHYDMLRAQRTFVEKYMIWVMVAGPNRKERVTLIDRLSSTLVDVADLLDVEGRE